MSTITGTQIVNQLILNSASSYLSGRQLSLLYARDRDGQAEAKAEEKNK